MVKLDELNDPERPICYGILKPGPDLPGGVPYVKVKHIRHERIDVASLQRTSNEIDESYRRSRLKEGDLLVTIRGTYGRVAPVPSELAGANITQDSARIAPVGVRPAFVQKYLQGPQAQEFFGRVARGVAVKGVNIGDLRQTPIMVPPLPEQDRIVAAIEEAFSKLDAGEAGLRAVRQLLKRMRDAILTAAVTGRLVPQDPTDTPATKLLADLGVEQAVGAGLPSGWTIAELGDLLEDIEAGKSFATQGRAAQPGETGVIKVSAMTWGEFRPTENKALPPGTSVDERWVIRANDLLFSRANTADYVGACVLVPQDHDDLILSDKSLRLRPTTGVDKRWLLYGLRSRPAREQIEQLATGTKESMRNVSQEKLRSLRLAVPPAEEQSRIAVEVDRQLSFVQACEQAVDVGLARSAGLRRSVLKVAFEGRLVPQDPSDEPASVLLERIRAERERSGEQSRKRRAKA